MIREEVDAAGFIHPGIGLTKDVLENARTQVAEGKEPWASYFERMSQSPAAARSAASSNADPADSTRPKTDAVNSKGAFVADGLKAYTQALMYVLSGDEVYRANALAIIRIWEQMDPAKYTYFADSHIHMGIPLNRMVVAAEILRYTDTNQAELKWTDQDTQKFTDNLIVPTTETFLHHNGYFMNQHLYPLLGAMSGYIFTGNQERYEEGVEWFTVNESAVDQGQNGSIKQLFRLVDEDILTGEPVDPPRVQHVEMGRDQAHGAGDLTNAEILARLLQAQGTRVDPANGTVSEAHNAVDAYEFLDHRLLAASDYFARFMLGYDIPWTPVAAHTDPAGNPTIVYKAPASGYRGRIGGNVYGQYYHYKYEAGLNIEAEAPYFADMFDKRLPFYWESPDGGADYWLFIPAEAASEGTQTLPRMSTDSNLNEVEYRATSLDGRSSVEQEGGVFYVRIQAAEEGSRVALVAAATAEKTIGFRIRTNGPAKLEVNDWSDDALVLPNTEGEWRTVVYRMNAFRGLGDLTYLNVTGPGTQVDLDHIRLNAGQVLTPPVFRDGGGKTELFTYADSQIPLIHDFAADDAGEGDALVYHVDDLPDGASFDSASGILSWQPLHSGVHAFTVSVSDGVSVTARSVLLSVSENRQAAIEAAASLYSEHTSYVSATREKFLRIHGEAGVLAGSAADGDFLLKLAELRQAAEELRQLTPLLPDGSMDYSDLVASSTVGSELPKLLDGAPDTFAFYGNAVDRTHTFDFGPNFGITADAFELQVRASFPERVGGTTLFGSNDKSNWTRLTPGMTAVSEDMQRLEVNPSLRTTPFRFLQIRMVQPSSTMLELSEFRIFGQRRETVNKLETVTLGAQGDVRDRVSEGASILLNFRSSEPIANVRTTIQGLEVQAQSDDARNWTAELPVDEHTESGAVRFRIAYLTAAGEEAPDTTLTTDGSSLTVADESRLIRDILSITELQDSSGRSPQALLQTAVALFDGKPNTITDFRVGGSGSGGYIRFDFGSDGVKLSQAELLARQDNYYTRIGGTVVQGSHNGVSWTTLTPAAVKTAEWQTLNAQSSEAYRYIRIYNGSSWYGNMAELRLHGETQGGG
ncbi:putative Ig domain-containing protein [Saccharibacillus sp. CPCC 101409]|uniref:putative Ig domain-containing protein n=1 Tax=Saccharibacillus sp. CPCC 101409 TaxID=3058041 RepID=UPI00267256B6|nr:putative Ig domain-containing protein [Saccharibacillus sp. CPCC 101409]MDO3411930.1 putative Ig domain-containing protein [Saccharibacillus sp. CPCC 101409]